MRAAIIALMLMIGSQAGAGCGNLCDNSWWETATEADVQAELDGGADVMARNEWGRTPLHRAGSPEVIQPLLAAGADVMARDAVGNTPLHKAAHYGYAEKIQALLTADADVMARDVSGSTPLHWAALHDAPASIQALLAAGADAKAKDKDGETPWALAQENEKLKGTKAYWALNDAQYN